MIPAGQKGNGAVATMLEQTTSGLSLTKAERAAGVAIRVPVCACQNDVDYQGDATGFLWSVLVFSKGETPLDVKPHWLTAIYCILIGSPASFEKLHSFLATIDGEPWTIGEFSMAMPRRLPFFALKAGGKTTIVSRSDRGRCVRNWFERIRNAFADEDAYPQWLDAHRQWMTANITIPCSSLKVSIVTPVYKTPPLYLQKMIDSVLAQTYVNWELVIVNASPDDEDVLKILESYHDERIVVVDQSTNRGIVGNTNTGIAAATGDYIAFLDHDDFIEPQALAAVVNAIEQNPQIDLLYCDEDSYRDESYCLPLFKPDMNLDLLYSNNYIIHFLVVSRRVLNDVELSTREVEGAQDYDLTFKIIEKGGVVKHLPYVLYHWRMHALSTNANANSKPYAQEAGRLAIQRHFERCGLPVTVDRDDDNFYHVRYAMVPEGSNILGIVTGSSFNERTRNALFECGRNHSLSAECIAMPGNVGSHELLSVLEEVKADYVLVTVPDVACDEEAVETLLSCFSRADVFSASPKVLRNDGLVESAGCMVTPEGCLVKLGKALPASDPAYVGRAMRPMDYLVVQDDLVIFRASLLKTYLGRAMGYRGLLYALNDCCIQAYEEAMSNAFTPYAVARIEGPRSFMFDWTAVSERDHARFVERNAALLNEGDPTYNPNLDPQSPYYRLGKRQLA